MSDTSVALQGAKETPVAITPIASLTDRIDRTFQAITQRAFEIFERNGHQFGHDIDDWFKAEMDLLHPVPVQVAEVGDNVEVRAEVPGFNQNEIEVSVEPGRLSIVGQAGNGHQKRKAGKDDLRGVMLGPDSANRRASRKGRCREGNGNFEGWCVAVDDAESGQGEDDPNQVPGQHESVKSHDGRAGPSHPVLARPVRVFPEWLSGETDDRRYVVTGEMSSRQRPAGAGLIFADFSLSHSKKQVKCGVMRESCFGHRLALCICVLRITVQNTADGLLLKLEGRVKGPWVEELRKCWLTSANMAAGEPVSVDLSAVNFVDASGA